MQRQPCPAPEPPMQGAMSSRQPVSHWQPASPPADVAAPVLTVGNSIAGVAVAARSAACAAVRCGRISDNRLGGTAGAALVCRVEAASLGGNSDGCSAALPAPAFDCGGGNEVAVAASGAQSTASAHNHGIVIARGDLRSGRP